jgi:hypothetical protein
MMASTEFAELTWKESLRKRSHAHVSVVRSEGQTQLYASYTQGQTEKYLVATAITDSDVLWNVS